MKEIKRPQVEVRQFSSGLGLWFHTCCRCVCVRACMCVYVCIFLRQGLYIYTYIHTSKTESYYIYFWLAWNSLCGQNSLGSHRDPPASASPGMDHHCSCFCREGLSVELGGKAFSYHAQGSSVLCSAGGWDRKAGHGGSCLKSQHLGTEAVEFL